jgi:pyruvate dehydrogenase E2 component (dihydrolipoamide acetyltransferase)
MTEIRMPRLSDSMVEGTIVKWLVADGATVDAGQEIVEIETDKATMPYEAYAEGTISILAGERATVPVGALIATIGPATDPPARGPASDAPARGRASDALARVLASPVARRLAEEGGVDLAGITGTGPGGRITRSDVEAAIERRDGPTAGSTPGSAAGSSPGPLPATDEPDDGQGTVEKLTNTQRLIAARMVDTTTVPQFTIQIEVDMREALSLRRQLKAAPDLDSAPSVNDLVLKAAAVALRRHPRVNASYREGEFELHEHVNVGVAVAAPDTLLVPTVADADAKALGAIAAETRDLISRARSGTLRPAELEGGTFTISNLGMFGITAVAPIPFAPQAAILGVGATREVLHLEDGRPTSVPVMTLTMTCDHRILYGADAAEFLSEVRRGLEHPLQLVV